MTSAESLAAFPYEKIVGCSPLLTTIRDVERSLKAEIHDERRHSTRHLDLNQNFMDALRKTKAPIVPV
jgi:hypothetical protein